MSVIGRWCTASKVHGCLIMLALAASSSGSLNAQALEGHVRDLGGTPVTGAVVRLKDAAGSQRDSAVTTGSGAFRLLAPKPGRYQISASHPDYQSRVSEMIMLGRDAVSIDVQLSAETIALEPIVVSGRRRDPRQEATYEGFYTRRELFPPVGGRRAVSSNDAPLRAALRVSDALRWFGVQTARSCKIVWWNGALINSWPIAESYLDDSAADLEGLEFYRSWMDAPLFLKDTPVYVADPWSCSVIVLWPRRPGVK